MRCFGTAVFEPLIWLYEFNADLYSFSVLLHFLLLIPSLSLDRESVFTSIMLS